MKVVAALMLLLSFGSPGVGVIAGSELKAACMSVKLVAAGRHGSNAGLSFTLVRGYRAETDAGFVAGWRSPDEISGMNAKLVPEGLAALLSREVKDADHQTV
ncbi:MAG: hypothetical protein JOZ96_28030 [Acidobacteria bacterium]|nr:hypothetical protein [Acidobacteriota bacterium]